eukprot:scaffold187460_cov35-Tisochrysis_lutea.AAC.3
MAHTSPARAGARPGRRVRRGGAGHHPQATLGKGQRVQGLPQTRSRADHARAAHRARPSGCPDRQTQAGLQHPTPQHQCRRPPVAGRASAPPQGCVQLAPGPPGRLPCHPRGCARPSRVAGWHW